MGEPEADETNIELEVFINNYNNADVIRKVLRDDELFLSKDEAVMLKTVIQFLSATDYDIQINKDCVNLIRTIFERVDERRSRASPKGMREVLYLSENERLSVKERDFVDGCLEFFRARGKLTPKQFDYLDKIQKKHGEPEYD